MMERVAQFTNIISILTPVRISLFIFCPPYAYWPCAGTNVTPVSGSDLYFGFGGVAVDSQKNGTVMVAALNSWWPDGQIFRSNDGGSTWSALWAWDGYPNLNKYYSYDESLAPWIGPPNVDTTLGDLQIGWMMECK